MIKMHGIELSRHMPLRRKIHLYAFTAALVAATRTGAGLSRGVPGDNPLTILILDDAAIIRGHDEFILYRPTWPATMATGAHDDAID